MIDTSHLVLLLQNLGLSKREAEIYLALLELNEALPSVIAKKVNQKRPTCYLVLEKLRDRGLASSVKKKGIIYYQAVKPDYFLEKERLRAQELEKTLASLSSALPELLSLHQKYTATPQMSVYYGKEGLIQIMEDTLSTKEDLLCWANIELAYNSLKEYYPLYIKKKVARKIWVRGIFCDDETAKRFKNKGEKELREICLIPKKEYPMQNEIIIYDDKVAILSHQDEVGVIIQNKNIADTQKAIFNLAFKQAKN